ncbi:MAG: hypothetical protein VYE73_11965 [Acidobacteriota bacterium]|nr:hypothetical protein [Acidobacteriota bacterium]
MSPRAAFVAAFAVALVLTSTAGAQEWIGSGGLGVSVRDEGSQPVIGAAVVLVPEFSPPDDAPPFVFTDGAGRVEVFNLADGEWAIEIRAAGFMIFNGYLKLVAGSPPVMGFSSRQRTGTFWQPLEVRFFEVGVDQPIMIGATENARKEEKKRRASTRKLAKLDERAARRAEKGRDRRATQGGGEVATLRRDEDDDPPEVAEAQPGSPAPRAEPPRAVEPQPIATQGAQPPPLEVADAAAGPGSPDDIQSQRRPPRIPPAPEPVPLRPAVIGTEVEPERQGAPPVFPPVRQTRQDPEPIEGRPVQVAEARPEPETTDIPDAPSRPPTQGPQRTVPSIQDRPVLLRGGACPECKPGEWSLVVEREAAPATDDGGGCGASRPEAVANLLSSGFAAVPAAAAFAGPVADQWGNEMPAELWAALGPEFGSSLRPSDASCQDLIAVLPQDARFIGFRFEASDESGRSDCFGEQPCPIGQARWMQNPQIERSPTVTVVHASFLNESQSRTRGARMTLYFRPLRGWEPPAGVASRSAPNRRR